MFLGLCYGVTCDSCTQSHCCCLVKIFTLLLTDNKSPPPPPPHPLHVHCTIIFSLSLLFVLFIPGSHLGCQIKFLQMELLLIKPNKNGIDTIIAPHTYTSFISLPVCVVHMYKHECVCVCVDVLAVSLCRYPVTLLQSPKTQASQKETPSIRVKIHYQVSTSHQLHQLSLSFSSSSSSRLYPFYH